MMDVQWQILKWPFLKRQILKMLISKLFILNLLNFEFVGAPICITVNLKSSNVKLFILA